MNQMAVEYNGYDIAFTDTGYKWFVREHKSLVNIQHYDTVEECQEFIDMLGKLELGYV